MFMCQGWPHGINISSSSACYVSTAIGTFHGSCGPTVLGTSDKILGWGDLSGSSLGLMFHISVRMSGTFSGSDLFINFRAISL